MRIISSILILMISVVLSCETKDTGKKDIKETETKPIVTFVELGSVSCVPCKMMQQVMEEVEKDYGEQIEVIFYDVWKPENKKYSEQYKVNLIPTQVFLDKDGKEIFRHEGFYPKEEIDKLLVKQGLKSLKEK